MVCLFFFLPLAVCSVSYCDSCCLAAMAGFLQECVSGERENKTVELSSVKLSKSCFSDPETMLEESFAGLNN
jgi:hypothetical protein